jgi:hypothetical protein
MCLPLDPQQVEEFFFFRPMDHHAYRGLLSSAARIEVARGPGYTMSEIADDLSLDLDDVLRLKRSGRAVAKRWRADGRGAPRIVLEHIGFRSNDERQGRVACYRLTPGAAEIVLDIVERSIMRWEAGQALEHMLMPRGRVMWPTLPSPVRK